MSELKQADLSKFKRTYNPCDECPYGIEKRDGSGNDSMCKICEFKELLDRRVEPENNPLTLEQLKQMDGEPVWIDVFDHNSFRKICYGIELFSGYISDTDCLKNEPMLDTGYSKSGLFIKDYGKTWLAYRQKPVSK